MEHIKQLDYEATPKDKQEYSILQIVNEMMARGINFLPVDIYKSKAKSFVIEDGAIRLPFITIDGLGDTAAESIEEYMRQNDVASIVEIQARTKLSGTLMDKMKELGAFGDLPEDSQMSLF